MRTPSGAIAIVVEIYDGIGEALVRRDADGEFMQFRLLHLRPLPGAEP